MAVFTTLRTARKPYRCADCLGLIRPGQRYGHSAITPADPEMGEDGRKRWGHLRTHVTARECEEASE